MLTARCVTPSRWPLPEIRFNFSVAGTILLNLGQINISKDLSINGPGPGNLTVDGNHNGQIFVVFATYNVSISGLTIVNGINMYGYGGGVYNTGTCSLTNVIFNNNSSVNPALGGGLYNEGIATLVNVIFSGNSSGGMFNSGLSTLTNVTFSANTGHGLVNPWQRHADGCDFQRQLRL